jgi:hypothetical protein
VRRMVTEPKNRMRGQMNTTVSEATEVYEKAHKILESILDEVTMRYFTDENSTRTIQAANRMLEIAPVIWKTPHDFLRVCLYEPLYEKHPQTEEDSFDIESLLRADAYRVSEHTTEKTTWTEFARAIEQSNVLSFS